MYQVKINPKIVKFLKRLSASDQKRLHKALKSLEKDPRPRGKNFKRLAKPFGGCRLRVGPLRILYLVDDEKKWVVVYKIGFRWFQLEGWADSDIALYIDGALKVKVSSQDAPQGKNKDQAWHYAEYVLPAGVREMKIIGRRALNGSNAYPHLFFQIYLRLLIVHDSIMVGINLRSIYKLLYSMPF